MIDRRAELIRLLTAYRPTDPDEQRYRTEIIDFTAAAIDPFDRHQYAPGHVTTSAFVVNADGSSVLLIHHARLDSWVQPGGHVEPEDATLIGAARREVAEETGVVDLEPLSDAILDIDIHVFPQTADQEEHRHFDIRFGFAARDDSIASNDEVHDAAWVKPEDLAPLEVDRSVLRPVEKLLGPDTLTP